MENFSYYNPVKVNFGAGIRKSIGNVLRGRYERALLVCSKGPFRENSLFDEIKKQLESADIKVFETVDIDSNPHISSVINGADVCKKNKIDVVVALGGGSTLDCSKLIAGAALTEMDPHRFLWPIDDKVIMEKALDMIFIPTMAATGTELNNTAVIMDEKIGHKSWCFSDVMFAKEVFLDPEVTLSLPLNITVWGAMDILSHIFEFYFNGYDEIIFQKKFSESLIQSVMECTDKLVSNPQDVVTRGELMWISIMAWGGLTKIGRGIPDMACHGSVPGIVARFNIHHGAALGVFTPRWMRYIWKQAVPQFSRFARVVMGVDNPDDKAAAEEGVNRFIDWAKKVECPATYADLGVKKPSTEDLRVIAEAMTGENGGSVGQMVNLKTDDVLNIYELCWKTL
jgi:alcohol dehydrogenase